MRLMLLFRFHIVSRISKYQVDNLPPNNVILRKGMVNLITDLTLFCLFDYFYTLQKQLIKNGKNTSFCFLRIVQINGLICQLKIPKFVKMFGQAQPQKKSSVFQLDRYIERNKVPSAIYIHSSKQLSLTLLIGFA